jgi:hypothetical protein
VNTIGELLVTANTFNRGKVVTNDKVYPYDSCSIEKINLVAATDEFVDKGRMNTERIQFSI